MTKQERKLMSLLMSGDKGSIHQALSLMDALGMETQETNDSLISQVTEYLYNNNTPENDYGERNRTLRKELVRFKGGVFKELVDSVDSVVNSLWPKDKKPTGSAIHGKNTQTLDFLYSIEGDYGPDSYQFGLAYTFTGDLKKSLKQKGLIQKDDQVYTYYDEDYFRFDVTLELNQINFNNLKLATTRSNAMRKLTKRQASLKLDELYRQLTHNKSALNNRSASAVYSTEVMAQILADVGAFTPLRKEFKLNPNMEVIGTGEKRYDSEGQGYREIIPGVPIQYMAFSYGGSSLKDELLISLVFQNWSEDQWVLKNVSSMSPVKLAKHIAKMIMQKAGQVDFERDWDADGDEEDVSTFYTDEGPNRRYSSKTSPVNGKHKRSRFKEGPEGTKEFEKWKAEQPEEFQEEWDANTEKYKDKFKQAKLTRRQASRALDRLHAQVVGTKRLRRPL